MCLSCERDFTDGGQRSQSSGSQKVFEIGFFSNMKCQVPEVGTCQSFVIVTNHFRLNAR